MQALHTVIIFKSLALEPRAVSPYLTFTRANDGCLVGCACVRAYQPLFVAGLILLNADAAVAAIKLLCDDYLLAYELIASAAGQFDVI